MKLLKRRVTIAEIHKDFRNAGDALLSEAKQIINNYKVEGEDIIERYRKLGLSSNVHVKAHDKEIKNLHENKTVHEMIEKWRFKYPNYQFITEQQLDGLNLKYHLAYAKAEFFTPDIPMKNLEEIENFKFKKEDHYVVWKYGGRSSLLPSEQSWRIDRTNQFDSFVEDDRRKLLAGMTVTIGHRQGNSREYKLGNQGFHIVGTKDMFELPSGMEWNDKTHTTKQSTPPDPIVLKKVIDGFLIITAWGPEAELPEINIYKQ